MAPEPHNVRLLASNPEKTDIHASSHELKGVLAAFIGIVSMCHRPLPE